MKRILSSIFFSLIVIAASAQNLATFKFMGVPVDGDRLDFIFQLKKKGFTYDSPNRVLKGKFNGIESIIFVHENNGKVDRVLVYDANPIYKRQTKIRFNSLIGQFNRNDKYFALEAEPIPEDEDISYEMLVNDKDYSAAYVFNPYHEYSEEEKDKMMNEIFDRVDNMVSAGYYELGLYEISGNAWEWVRGSSPGGSDKTDEELDSIAAELFMMNVIGNSNGLVSFRIEEIRGEYVICLYYDNIKNRPNGEDL